MVFRDYQAFVLGSQDRGEAAVPVARHVDAQWRILGQNGLVADAVAGLSASWACPRFGPQGALDQRLLEGHRGGIERFRRHRTGDQLANQSLRNARQLGRRFFLLILLGIHTPLTQGMPDTNSRRAARSAL